MLGLGDNIFRYTRNKHFSYVLTFPEGNVSILYKSVQIPQNKMYKDNFSFFKKKIVNLFV